MASLTEALEEVKSHRTFRSLGGLKARRTPSDGNQVRSSPAQNPAAAEQGFVLIEILVSALVLVIASAGVVGLIVTTVHAQSEQRHGSEAYALAQEDQARLASMQLPLLNHLDQTREIALNQATFKVRSLGLFISNKTSAQSCVEGSSESDYVQITSKVTWPGMASSEKAVIVSILSPSGSKALDPSHSSVAVSVASEQKTPMPGVEVAATGGQFKAFTDAAGCVIFPDLAKGNYPTIVSGAAAGLVNKDGKSSEEVTLPVAEEMKLVSRQFDHPGTIPVNFKYRVGSTAAFTPVSADSIVAYNTNMTTAKTFWTPTAAREATVNVTPLYPFTSPYTIYAGSCSANNPNPEGKSNPPSAPAIANVVAPAGGTATPVTIQLPALETIVKNGAAAIAGAKVTITDKTCKESKNVSLIKRVYTTNESGLPSSSIKGAAELGLPWGAYEICASANISGSFRRKKVTSVTVQNLAAATSLPIDLSTGTESGECP
jgi:Tfp pilus assembly protein PilV